LEKFREETGQMERDRETDRQFLLLRPLL